MDFYREIRETRERVDSEVAASWVLFAYSAYFAVLISRATSQTQCRTTRSRRTAAPLLRSALVVSSDRPSAPDPTSQRRSLTCVVSHLCHSRPSTRSA